MCVNRMEAGAPPRRRHAAAGRPTRRRATSETCPCPSGVAPPPDAAERGRRSDISHKIMKMTRSIILKSRSEHRAHPRRRTVGHCVTHRAPTASKGQWPREQGLKGARPAPQITVCFPSEHIVLLSPLEGGISTTPRVMSERCRRLHFSAEPRYAPPSTGATAASPLTLPLSRDSPQLVGRCPPLL